MRTIPKRASDAPIDALTLEMLAWLARKPRSYAETMEAWRTSCPCFPFWEDALDRGLICVEHGNGIPMRGAPVGLTPLGRVYLGGPSRLAQPADEEKLPIA